MSWALVALSSFILTVPPAPTVAEFPHTILIFAGGTTLQEGNAALQDWERLLPAFDGIVATAEGFPRVVESATVAGLKPGFFVVVLGVCESKAGQIALTSKTPGTADDLPVLYKAIDSRIYSRRGLWKEGLGCPRALDEWLEPETANAKVSVGTMSYAGFFTALARGEITPGLGTRQVAILRDRANAILDIQTDNQSCGEPDARSAKDAIIVKTTCETGACTTIGTSRYETRYFAKGKKVEVTVKETVLGAAQCD